LAKLLGNIGDEPEWNNFGHSQGTALLKADTSFSRPSLPGIELFLWNFLNKKKIEK
jgi:hypothetical protein